MLLLLAVCLTASPSYAQKVNQPPVVSVTAPAIVSVNTGVTVTGTSSDPDSPLAPQQWRYDFGDGGAATGKGAVGAVQHFYRALSDYTVTLTVVDNKGFSGIATTIIRVIAPPPPLPDTTAPTIPTNLIASVVAQTALTITWSPSTDNIGVAKYEVWITNTLVQEVTATTANFTALTCGAIYSMDVAAVDAAGNRSLKKNLTAVTSLCNAPSAASPDLTRVPPSSQIVDTGTNVWTLSSGNAVLKNGQQWENGLGTVLTWCAGMVRTLGMDANWWDATTSGWNSIGPTDPCVTTSPVIVNPTKAVFTPPPDHVTGVLRYELEIYGQSSGALITRQDIGKPTPDANNEITYTGLAALLASVPAGTYLAKVVAVRASGGAASEPSNAFAVAVL